MPASPFEAADIVPPEREFCLYVVATDDAWIPFKDDWGIPSDLLSVCPS
ncbi:hypothetical protein [Tessaracoccus defluvii]|uniref:Uncharacterized protein n=1 Tax=Tessaracoccus defluvii TaxID=1285901 RepID=A0A7H0H8F8_9ACTN|nr:hypothetical protein [Tessaracoccus defluvii]QNP56824.1 hypothetical protein H9L22_05590 [Tessaracoccus defluvii]